MRPSSSPGPLPETPPPVVQPVRISRQQQAEPSQPSAEVQEHFYPLREGRHLPEEPEGPSYAETPTVRRLAEPKEEGEVERPSWGPEPGGDARRSALGVPLPSESGQSAPALAQRAATQLGQETGERYTALAPSYDSYSGQVRPLRARADESAEHRDESPGRRRVIADLGRGEARADESALSPVYSAEGVEAHPAAIQRRIEAESALHFAVREERASVPREERLPLQRVPLSQALFRAWPERTSTQVARQPAEPSRARADGRRATQPRPPSPLVQMNVIRRVTAETEGASATPTGVTTEATGAASADETDQPDIDELADKVYRRIRERLRLERERFGGFRYR